MVRLSRDQDILQTRAGPAQSPTSFIRSWIIRPASSGEPAGEASSGLSRCSRRSSLAIDTGRRPQNPSAHTTPAGILWPPAASRGRRQSSAALVQAPPAARVERWAARRSELRFHPVHHQHPCAVLFGPNSGDRLTGEVCGLHLEHRSDVVTKPGGLRPACIRLLRVEPVLTIERLSEVLANVVHHERVTVRLWYFPAPGPDERHPAERRRRGCPPCRFAD